MTDNDGNRGCCRCCTSFILTIGFSALFIWLSLRASNPTCSIQEFYLPALNKSANSTSNHTLYFDLRLKNGNKDKGIHYDALNLTFYYGSNQSIPIGGANFSGFYQGHKKKAHRNQLLETHDMPWDVVLRAVSNETTVFRVDLATGVRFKILAWNTKRKRLVVGLTVKVNNTLGTIANGAPELGCYRARWAVFVVFSVLIFLVAF